MTCECQSFDTVELDEFLPYILPSVKGCPPEIAAHAARLAAIEMARKTSMVKRTVWMFAQMGVDFYDLQVEDCEKIHLVDQVCVLGRDYHRARKLEHCMPSCHFFYEKGHGLHLSTPPGCDRHRGIEVTLSVVPDQDACVVDRCFYDNYAEVIEHGALSRLYLMKSGEWYDGGLSRIHQRSFLEGVKEANVATKKANSSGPQHMRYKRFV